MCDYDKNALVVRYLNDAFENDPDAIHALLCNRVPCNTKLVEHPHVVVGKNNITKGWTVSNLGIINGLLTSIGLKRVAMKWSDVKNPDGTYTFEGFVIAGDESQPASSQT